MPISFVVIFFHQLTAIRLKTFILAAVLGATSLPTAYCHAAPGGTQPAAAADSSQHRWTIGLQLTDQAYRLRYTDGAGFQNFGPLQLSVGYRWKPRWTVEVGTTYWRDNYHWTAVGTTISGEPVEEDNRSQAWKAAVPVRVRYTLTRQPAHRLQFDALGGVAVAFTRSTSEWVRTESGVETSRYQGTSTGYGVSASLGVGGRLGLGKSRRLEIAGELLLNQNLQSANNQRSLDYRPVFSPLGSWGLGLRYRL